jgi:hypothetical protein
MSSWKTTVAVVATTALATASFVASPALAASGETPIGIKILANGQSDMAGTFELVPQTAADEGDWSCGGTWDTAGIWSWWQGWGWWA